LLTLAGKRRAAYRQVRNDDQPVLGEIEIERRQVVSVRQRHDDAARARDEEHRRHDLRQRHGEVAHGVQQQFDEHGAGLLQMAPNAADSNELDAVRCMRRHTEIYQ